MTALAAPVVALVRRLRSRRRSGRVAVGDPDVCAYCGRGKRCKRDCPMRACPTCGGAGRVPDLDAGPDRDGVYSAVHCPACEARQGRIGGVLRPIREPRSGRHVRPLGNARSGGSFRGVRKER